MSTIYDQILDDLLQTTPENVTMILPSIDDTQTPELQILHRYRLLQRATRRRDRQMTLLHAYYIGELLDQIVNRRQHGFVSNSLSTYYKIVCTRTFYLFEKTGVEQIMRTRKTTLRSIYRLKAADFQLLTGP
jgi:hypothetical protein